MAFQGERFNVNLSSDEDDGPDASAPLGLVPGFVKDVRERPAPATHYSATALKSTSHGFPAHRKRNPVSKFKQNRVSDNHVPVRATSIADCPSPVPDSGQEVAGGNGAAAFETFERSRIDQENRQRLSEMSDEAIAKERQEIIDVLSPSLVQRLMERANISDHVAESHYPSLPDADNDVATAPSTQKRAPSRTSDDVSTSPKPSPPHPNIDVAAPPSPAAAANPNPPPVLPTSPQSAPPTLDPADPDFLNSLHEKYFPSLSHDPSKLAWMTSPSEYEDAPYDPSAKSLPPPALRFSFRGALLPPRTALALPTTLGLHHHAAAPDAAGYTLPELAHLSRSTVPAQRCIALQTLGRVLYRLGRGEWGGPGSALVDGLWECVRRGRVLETMMAEAGEGNAEQGWTGRHVSVRAYAVEALWLWRRGGGKGMEGVTRAV